LLQAASGSSAWPGRAERTDRSFQLDPLVLAHTSPAPPALLPTANHPAPARITELAPGGG
jgi:hypothetical protein